MVLHAIQGYGTIGVIHTKPVHRPYRRPKSDALGAPGRGGNGSLYDCQSGVMSYFLFPSLAELAAYRLGTWDERSEGAAGGAAEYGSVTRSKPTDKVSGG